MNLFDRYQRDPLGLDSFNAWMRHYETLHTKFPLGCAKVSEEWLDLWEGLGELLKMPARIEYFPARYREWTPIFGIAERVAVARCLQKVMTSPLLRGKMVRVALLDGTVVKEWGPR